MDIVKDERGHEPVFQALDIIVYKKNLSGYYKVVIKGNFICEKLGNQAPLLIPSLLKQLFWVKALPVKVYVVESDATMTNGDKAFEATGMKEMCLRNGGWMAKS